MDNVGNNSQTQTMAKDIVHKTKQEELEHDELLDELIDDVNKHIQTESHEVEEEFEEDNPQSVKEKEFQDLKAELAKI